MIVFGKGGDGQLGIRTDKSGFQPTPIPIPITSSKKKTKKYWSCNSCVVYFSAVLGSLAIRQVACGKNHTMLLTDSGDVYTFGASTMGQCGHGHLNSTKVTTRRERETEETRRDEKRRTKAEERSSRSSSKKMKEHYFFSWKRL